MKLIKLALIAVSSLAVVGHYLQQRRRLGIIRGLPGHKARAYYEATRQRDEWMMVVLAALFATGAAAALVYVFVWPALRAGAR